jgi:predicted DNA-binding protein with PD1-like motif
MENIIAMRLTPGTDVLAGIIEACEKYNIKDGVIISALGSWREVTFCNPIDLPNGKKGYGDPTILEGNYELVSLSGIICHDTEGKILPHIHLTISDEKGNAYGGHMMPGCEVLLTTDLVIGTFAGIVMGRRYDEELGVPLFYPSNK